MPREQGAPILVLALVLRPDRIVPRHEIVQALARERLEVQAVERHGGAVPVHDAACAGMHDELYRAVLLEHVAVAGFADLQGCL